VAILALAFTPIFGDTYTPDGWHEVGTSGEPAFYAPTIVDNAGGVWQDLRFRLIIDGRVEIQGVVEFTRGYDESLLFTLPIGYRPDNHLRIPVISEYEFFSMTDDYFPGATLIVYPDGRVYLDDEPNGAGNMVGIQTTFTIDISESDFATIQGPAGDNGADGADGIHSSGAGWIKYTNGTMICWQNITASYSNTNVWTSGQLTWPQAFSSTPTATMSSTHAGWRYADLQSFDAISATNYNLRIHLHAVVTASGTVMVIAIGPWQ
jgi:hypothetical protein